MSHPTRAWGQPPSHPTQAWGQPPYGMPGSGVPSTTYGPPQVYGPGPMDFFQAVVQGDIPMVRIDASKPLPWVPNSPNVATDYRDFTATLTNGAVGTPVSLSIDFDYPVRVFHLMGWSASTNGTGLPVGATPLSVFRVLFARGLSTQTERLTSGETLASNILGTAQRPRVIPGDGWLFANSALTITITPLIANMTIDVTVAGFALRAPMTGVYPNR